MVPFTGGTPYCKRCGRELEGSEEGCPECGFNPKQKGLRVSMALLLVVAISMTLVTLTLPFWTGPAPYLVGVAAVAFGLAVVVLVVSFAATPYRLGSLFTRL